jgi:hypothetical protein
VSAGKENCIARALTLPVAAPAAGVWADVRGPLAACWRMATDLANWGAGELFLADVVARRAAEPGQMPPAPAIDLYNQGFTRKQYPGVGLWKGCAGSASQVLRDVRAHYLRHRKAALWSHGENPAAYRYPYPWPVRAQELKVRQDPDGRPVVELTLPSGRVALRLRGGSGERPEADYARQARLFVRVARGELAVGCASVYRQRCSESCHRPTLEDRAPGGGQRVLYREMVKLVYFLPRAERPAGGLAMELRTDPHAFWVAETAGRCERPWVLNADHVVTWVLGHRAYLRRVGEDLKPEKSWPKSVRRQINEAREKRCDKHHRRIDTWVKQAVALVTNYCRRRKVALVAYDDACRDYLPAFPWHRLKTALASKLEELGVEFLAREEEEAVAGGETLNGFAGAARVEEVQ